MEFYIKIILICAYMFIPAIISGRLRSDDGLSSRIKRQRQDEDLSDEEIRNSIPECQPFNPQIPNYWTNGRRVSQVKCLEIVWDMKFRAEKKDRADKCLWAVWARKGLYGGGGGVGGRNARIGEFPHMGAVGWKAVKGTWKFKCGASLVSEKFVLTAGHCIRASTRDPTISDPVPKIVRLGDNNIIESSDSNRAPVDAIIERIIPHPEYKSPMMYNDIALMELEEPVEFSFFVHPACLWASGNISSLGQQATSTGWGVVETVKYTTSPDLQVVVLDFIRQEYCDSLLRPYCNRRWCGLRSSQLCAGKLEGGVDACQGDSGGPLQVKIKLPKEIREALHYVIGVTSFGVGCAKANTPGVYTRVSSYIDWIEQTVWGSHGVIEQYD